MKPPKAITSISLDYEIAKKARDNNLNISAICEVAISKALDDPNAPKRYKRKLLRQRIKESIEVKLPMNGHGLVVAVSSELKTRSRGVREVLNDWMGTHWKRGPDDMVLPVEDDNGITNSRDKGHGLQVQQERHHSG
jgi:hypothetical protein